MLETLGQISGQHHGLVDSNSSELSTRKIIHRGIEMALNTSVGHLPILPAGFPKCFRLGPFFAFWASGSRMVLTSAVKSGYNDLLSNKFRPIVKALAWILDIVIAKVCCNDNSVVINYGYSQRICEQDCKCTLRRDTRQLP